MQPFGLIAPDRRRPRAGPAVRPRRASVWLILAGSTALAATGASLGQPGPGPAPVSSVAGGALVRGLPLDGWSPEAGAALEAYQAGDYGLAQRLAQGLRGAAAAGVRRDAAALLALCLMQSDARSERADGRARLAELVADHPQLAARAECALAMGVAHLGLHETGKALEFLEQAIERFLQLAQPERALAALVALAETWSQHNEWTLMSPRFQQDVPGSPKAAAAVRVAQIEQIRARAAELPGAADALARIDRLLVELQAAEDGAAEDGNAKDGGDNLRRERLAEIALREPATRTTLSTALELAAEYASLDRPDAALLLYDHVRASPGPPEVRTAAEDARFALLQPALEVSAPDTIPAESAAMIELRVRGYARAQLEVRRVELGEWLRDRRTRGREAHLPESGSLVHLREFEIPPQAPGAWWRAVETADFRAGPGAYVIRASAGEQVSKRLLLVTDLVLAAQVGPRRALFWLPAATHTAQAPAPAGLDPDGQFWMGGSFMPTPIVFRNGRAELPLPAEARLMREREWFALIRVAGHETLLRGTLAGAAGAHASDLHAGVVVGPPDPRVGERLHVLGVLGGPMPDVRVVRVEIVDLMEEVRLAHEASLRPEGVFQATFEIPPELAGRHAHVAVRCGGRIVPNLAERARFVVAPADAAPLELDVRFPARLTSPVPILTGRLAAWYPWGPAAGRLYADMIVRGLTPPPERPLPGGEFEPYSSRAVTRRVRLDEQARGVFSFALSDLHLPGGPAVVGLWPVLRSSDGRATSSFQRIVCGPESAQLWVRPRPALPKSGEAVVFEAAWLGLEPLRQPPLLRIRSGGAVLAERSLHAGGAGLRSAPWLPPAPGSYELELEAVLANGEARHATWVLEVLGDSAEAAAFRVLADLSGRLASGPTGATLHVERFSPGGPAGLIVALDGEDPLAAASLDADASTATLALDPAQVAGLRAEFWTQSESGGVLRRAVLLSTDAPVDASLRLALVAPAIPGGEGVFSLTGATAQRQGVAAQRSGTAAQRSAGPAQSPGMVLANLMPAELGQPDWLSRAGVAESPDPRLPEVLRQSLFAGTSLAAGAFELRDDGAADIRIPLPVTPGLYRLSVAVLQDGQARTASLLFDSSDQPGLRLNLPERLSTGDRSLAALVLQNRGGAAVSATLRFEAGSELALAPPRIVAAAATQSHPPGEPLTIRIPAGEAVRVTAGVEAVRPGAAVVRAIVNCQGVERVVAATAHISDPGLHDAAGGRAAESAPFLRMTRTFGRRIWDHEPPEFDTSASEPTVTPLAGSGAAYDVYEPHGRLRCGEVLLIREELEVLRPLRRVQWRQGLPPTVFGVVHYDQRLTSPLLESTLGLDELTYQAEELPPGRYIHEYAVLAVRPGAGLLPPPDVRSADGAAPVEISSGMVRLIVAER